MIMDLEVTIFCLCEWFCLFIHVSQVDLVEKVKWSE